MSSWSSSFSATDRIASGSSRTAAQTSGLPPARHLASKVLHASSRSSACSTGNAPDSVNEPVAPSDRLMPRLPLPDATNQLQFPLDRARRTPDLRRDLLDRIPVHPQKRHLPQFRIAQYRQEPLALLGHLRGQRRVRLSPEHVLEYLRPGYWTLPSASLESRGVPV